MEKKNNILKIQKFSLKILYLLNVGKILLGKNKIIYKKNNLILKKFLNQNFFIFKGQKFRLLNINLFYLRQRFGFFTFTKKPFKYVQKSKIISKNNIKR
jgi:ribosomal protein S19